jgi:hypothetical protein
MMPPYTILSLEEDGQGDGGDGGGSPVQPSDPCMVRFVLYPTLYRHGVPLSCPNGT